MKKIKFSAQIVGSCRIRPAIWIEIESGHYLFYDKVWQF